MANEQYQRAKAIYYQVCEMEPSERTAFLDHACKGDEALRRDIDALLRVEDNGQFLRQPVLDHGQLLHRAVAGLSSDLGSCRLPLSFGRYRVLRLISEGGMGSVYEAEQDSPQRIVALKVIRSAFPSKQMVQRFEREIQILGRLRHPNIAQIYDADTAELSAIDGTTTRPAYYTMEFINGLPLIEHANQNALTDRERLKLLAKVCDAVHFGHTHGVVHRDLKPSNIMVEASGEPKIIDFGVARATNLDQMGSALNTRSGALLGTLAYMCPEQVTGHGGSANEREGNPLDGRGDVYALGVIGFELLGGRLPFDFAGRSIPETARIILDEEPTSLSSISREYRGDVETIVRKAMAKEPARRYQSAAELAADIRRFLNDEPILARPPTLRYQLGKFTRRHKELVAGLVLVVLVLITGVVTTATGWMRAIESENVARHDATMAKKTSDALLGILAYAKPGMEGGGREVRVVEMLNASSQSLGEQLEGFPEIEAVARRTLGETYFNLGYYNEAETSLRRALALTAALEPAHAADALIIQERLAKTLLSTGLNAKRSESLVLARSTFADALLRLGPKHPTTQIVQLTLCDALLTEAWNSPETVPLVRGLIDDLESLPKDQRAVSIPAVMWRLVTVLWRQERTEEMEEVKNEALALQATSGSGVMDHETTVLQLSALGWIAEAAGQLEECEHMFRQVLVLQRSHLGRRHPSTMELQSQFAIVLARLGKLEEALALQRDDLEACQGPDSKNRLASNKNWIWNLHMYIAGLLDRLGRTDESRTVFLAGIAVSRRMYGDTHLLTREVCRVGTMRHGLRVQQVWASEALRTHVRQMVETLLLAHPTGDLDLDAIDWSKLRWSIAGWNAKSNLAEFNSAERQLPSAGLNDLWTAPDPRTGLHRVSLSLDCSESGPLSSSTWMLVAPWNVQLYRTYRTYTAERWEAALRGPPVETQHLPALALAGWWGSGEGFGPRHADYSFGVVATATVEWPAGQYRLLVDADDCVRVFVDGQLVIERWGADHGAAVEVAVIQSDGGPQTIRVEYFQNGGDSRLWVRAEPVD